MNDLIIDDIFVERQTTLYAEAFGLSIKGNEKAIQILESVSRQTENARLIIWDKWKTLNKDQKDDYTRLLQTGCLLREAIAVAKGGKVGL
jgi:hypothetical protein